MLQPSDFTPIVINSIVSILNQGYECEIKYAGDKLVVLKIKRKLLYKVADESDIKNYLLDGILENLKESQDVKVEFKKEREKTAIVLVRKVDVNRAK